MTRHEDRLHSLRSGFLSSCRAENIQTELGDRLGLASCEPDKLVGDTHRILQKKRSTFLASRQTWKRGPFERRECPTEKSDVIVRWRLAIKLYLGRGSRFDATTSPSVDVAIIGRVQVGVGIEVEAEAVVTPSCRPLRGLPHIHVAGTFVARPL